jgi:hypothetical protein
MFRRPVDIKATKLLGSADVRSLRAAIVSDALRHACHDSVTPQEGVVPSYDAFLINSIRTAWDRCSWSGVLRPLLVALRSLHGTPTDGSDATPDALEGSSFDLLCGPTDSLLSVLSAEATTNEETIQSVARWAHAHAQALQSLLPSLPSLPLATLASPAEGFRGLYAVLESDINRLILDADDTRDTLRFVIASDVRKSAAFDFGGDDAQNATHK